MECRICLDDNKNNLYKNICDCKGSLNYVHKECLLNWLNKKEDNTCEICKTKYDIQIVSCIHKLDIVYISLLLCLVCNIDDYVNVIMLCIVFYYTNKYILGIYVCMLLNTYNHDLFFVLFYFMMLCMYDIFCDNTKIQLNCNKLVKK